MGLQFRAVAVFGCDRKGEGNFTQIRRILPAAVFAIRRDEQNFACVNGNRFIVRKLILCPAAKTQMRFVKHVLMHVGIVWEPGEVVRFIRAVRVKNKPEYIQLSCGGAIAQVQVAELAVCSDSIWMVYNRFCLQGSCLLSKDGCGAGARFSKGRGKTG